MAKKSEKKKKPVTKPMTKMAKKSTKKVAKKRSRKATAAVATPAPAESYETPMAPSAATTADEGAGTESDAASDEGQESS